MKPCFVVFTDLSAFARQLASYAAGVGAPLGVRLHLLHFYHTPSVDPELVTTTGFHRSQAETGRMLRKMAQSLPAEATVTVSTEPVDQALAQAARYCYPILLVLGLSDEQALLDHLLRNQLLSALRATHRPLLLVPPGAAWQPAPRRVAVAIDGEEFTLNAAAHRLVPLLRAWSASWTAVHVETPDEHQAFRGQRALGTLRESGLLDKQTALALYESQEVLPTAGILQALHDTRADLLVLIVRPRSFLSRLFHHSVTARVLRNCPVPVLLLPAEDPDRPGWMPTMS
ncbi:universal stress protein [Hymenobacter psychrophilus]|uniref:Nucleotide-binding universal stress protein, UspA family n=1 Tax=Hymenobacter psychrophilus TaxID=651662 RepID=A0A1H3K6H8_9BACT|nr:universal stress protein [Hymenobacter psychrophilus]SDY47810.1 Nucleotide-binding universal stress protein, UspA family [Hymenobacter psychrophilus]